MDSLRLLLIDDTDFGSVLEKAVRDAGQSSSGIAVATDMRQAVQRLWQLCWRQPDQLPHLIVVSTRFAGGGSGYRLLRFLHRHPVLRRIPLMAYCPGGSSADRRRARALGARFCVDKSAGTVETSRFLAHVLRLVASPERPAPFEKAR